MRIRITGGRILTPQEMLVGQDLLIEGNKIAALASASAIGPADQTIDASGLWVTPGLIDVHVHGGGGHDTMDATTEAIHGMARFFRLSRRNGLLPHDDERSG